jgi:predicted cation transporter
MFHISRRISVLTRLIALTLLFAVPSTTFAIPTATHPPMDAVKLQKKLAALGTGNHVKVTEIDGAIIRGSLVSIDADSLKVAPINAPQPITIPNTQVANVGKDGMSEGAKLGIGIGVGLVVGLGIIVIVIAAASHH